MKMPKIELIDKTELLNLVGPLAPAVTILVVVGFLLWLVLKMIPPGLVKSSMAIIFKVIFVLVFLSVFTNISFFTR